MNVHTGCATRCYVHYIILQRTSTDNLRISRGRTRYLRECNNNNNSRNSSNLRNSHRMVLLIDRSDILVCVNVRPFPKLLDNRTIRRNMDSMGNIRNIISIINIISTVNTVSIINIVNMVNTDTSLLKVIR